MNIATHPEIEKKMDQWSKVKALIENDRKRFEDDDFCRKVPNETNAMYNARKKMFAADFINPSIDLLTAPAHTIYGKEIAVKFTKEQKRLTGFVDNCTMGVENEVSLKEYMRQNTCLGLRGYGTVFLLLDMPDVTGYNNEKAQFENRIWPYITGLAPESIRYFEIVNGELMWFAYTVTASDPWLDPVQKKPASREELRVWTKESYTAYNGDDVVGYKDNPWGLCTGDYQSGVYAFPGGGNW